MDQVLGDLTVKRSGTTFVIDIGFTSRDPAKAAQIANAFADKYLLEQLEAKLDATQQATLSAESAVSPSSSRRWDPRRPRWNSTRRSTGCWLRSAPR